MSLQREPLMPYLFRMAALIDKAAGGTQPGIPKIADAAEVSMSHKGRQLFSPKRRETVQARQGLHQKP